MVTEQPGIASDVPEMIIDVHPDPAEALVDGDQALEPTAFGDLMIELRSMAAALGLSL